MYLFINTDICMCFVKSLTATTFFRIKSNFFKPDAVTKIKAVFDRAIIHHFYYVRHR